MTVNIRLFGKFIFLTVFLFSACVNRQTNSIRNDNFSFHVFNSQTTFSKDRLVCCKKRCVLASAVKFGERYEF